MILDAKPGLIDTHVHTAFTGFQEQTVNFPEGLKEAGEIHDFLASVQEDPRLRIGDVIYLSNVNIEEYWNQLPQVLH